MRIKGIMSATQRDSTQVDTICKRLCVISSSIKECILRIRSMSSRTGIEICLRSSKILFVKSVRVSGDDRVIGLLSPCACHTHHEESQRNSNKCNVEHTGAMNTYRYS